ncbi:hypothetical protein ABTE09_20675, partial [Acinetobacter baumannii]
HRGQARGELLLYYDAPPAAAMTRCAHHLAAHAAVVLANAADHAQALLEKEQLLCAERELRTSQELLKQGERFNHAGSMRYLV